MTPEDLFNSFLASATVGDVRAAVDAFAEEHGGDIDWEPVGRENNRGTIEASADPGRALIERMTNGIDAVLENEHDAHHGVPTCRSPREASIAWLGVPDAGVSGMTPRQRQSLAQRVVITLEAGDGTKDRRTVSVRDFGTGISSAQMPDTILSLGASNKITKHYLAGAYGQGGSATFAVSKFSVIASRVDSEPTVAFTVVKYLDLPAEIYKTGHYVYMQYKGAVLTAAVPLTDFPAGTLVRHFGYDLSDYGGPVGTNSVYGLLQRALFDPVMPVYLDSKLHGYRRTIKGARNALNGAVDEGDEGGKTSLAHHVPMFFSTLGDYGQIGIEYWVLEAAKGTPTAAFVDPGKPIVLTINGQNHAELSQLLVRKYAELPYLRTRLILHVDCNGLTPDAKRALFVSNREEARKGALYDLVQQEVIQALRSDDELARLNTEARQKGLKEKDEVAVKQMRAEVAKLLRLQGLPVVEGVVSAVTSVGTSDDPAKKPRGPRGPRTPRPAIELHEPPSYIKLLWADSEPITFYKDQRRYIRVETDANSNYHTPEKPSASRINVIVNCNGVSASGSTPLQGGRMRVILRAAGDPPVGSEGVLRVELSRTGQATLSDERPLAVVAPPKATAKSKQLTLPEFEVRAVNGPDDDRWGMLEWPQNVTDVASSAEPEEGKLIIWYSTVYPAYATALAKLEQQDTAMAASFTDRYETWLAVHSLLKLQDEKDAEATATDEGKPLDEEDSEEATKHDRLERCRIATLSALFATREVKEGITAEASE